MERMEVMQLGEGFWRWTAPHPEWTPAKERPGGWGQRVGCLYLETSDGIVLIDPLAPPDESDDGRRFWEVLDREVARLGKPVTILLGNHFHQRSAPRVLERYRERPGAEAWAPEKTRRLLTCDVTRTFSPPEMLSGALQAHSIAGLECPGETVFFVPQHRALVCADALIGAGNGLIRVPPIRWAENTPQGQELYRKEFRASLGKLNGLEIDMVLVSHGEPVLTDGSAALAEALAAPAWGEN